MFCFYASLQDRGLEFGIQRGCSWQFVTRKHPVAGKYHTQLQLLARLDFDGHDVLHRMEKVTSPCKSHLILECNLRDKGNVVGFIGSCARQLSDFYMQCTHLTPLCFNDVKITAQQLLRCTIAKEVSP
jgi:hypothetical protein